MKSSVAIPNHHEAGAVLAQAGARLLQRLGILSRSSTLPWIIVSLGFVLRLSQYLFNRSLWLDESRIALNVINRSYSELLQPLDHNQGAPIGFLVLEKLAVQALGQSEYALRLLPFLSGAIALPLFYAVAKRCVSPGAVPLALGLFAITDSLIHYSSDLKQYSSDVAVTLVLYLATIHVLSRDLSKLRMAMLGLLGATAVWFSHPAAFVLAGLGVVLSVRTWTRNPWAKPLGTGGIGALSVAFLPWVVSFLASYYVSLDGLSRNRVLLNYWSDSFVPFPPRSLPETQWLVYSFFNLLADPVGQTLPCLAGLVFIAGCASALSREREKFLVLASPALFALLASALHKYPFGGRLMLFIVPAAVLMIAEGAARIREKTAASFPLMGIALIVLLFYHPLYSAAYHLAKPRVSEEIKPVLSHTGELRQPGDVLYVYAPSRTAFWYYADRYGFKDEPYTIGVDSGDWREIQEDLDRVRGNHRVWVLMSHVLDWRGVNQETFYLYYLDRIGQRLDTFRSNGASVHLYDLSE